MMQEKVRMLVVSIRVDMSLRIQRKMNATPVVPIFCARTAAWDPGQQNECRENTSAYIRDREAPTCMVFNLSRQ